MVWGTESKRIVFPRKDYPIPEKKRLREKKEDHIGTRYGAPVDRETSDDERRVYKRRIDDRRLSLVEERERRKERERMSGKFTKSGEYLSQSARIGPGGFSTKFEDTHVSASNVKQKVARLSHKLSDLHVDKKLTFKNANINWDRKINTNVKMPDIHLDMKKTSNKMNRIFKSLDMNKGFRSKKKYKKSKKRYKRR